MRTPSPYEVPAPHAIYVAGKMRGEPLFGFPRFDAATALLRAAGWFVYSPAEHDREVGFNPETDQPDALFIAASYRWDAGAITRCQAIYFLQGWERSQGAADFEFPLARRLGLRIYFEPEEPLRRGGW